MTSSQWTITPLILATGLVDRSMTLLYRDPGVKQEGPVISWLLEGNDMKILVDTGPAGPFQAMDEIFHQTPEQKIESQLLRNGVSPDDISMIINTHLHTDHCSGNAYFNNIDCLVQRSEIEYAKNPLKVHEAAYNITLDGINFRLLDGDAEIAPGLQVIHTPGHSPGSQAVVVHTANGVYIIAGDTIPSYENTMVPDNEPFWPSGIFCDLKEYYLSLGRIKALGGFILPSHDISVLKKTSYP